MSRWRGITQQNRPLVWFDASDNLSEIMRGDGLKYVLKYNAFKNLESIEEHRGTVLLCYLKIELIDIILRVVKETWLPFLCVQLTF